MKRETRDAMNRLIDPMHPLPKRELPDLPLVDLQYPPPIDWRLAIPYLASIVVVGFLVGVALFLILH